MEQLFDVIIIGAGNGGLAGALDCTRAGKKVLLLEKNPLPGGCATAFCRGRFEFEASLHELCAMGTEEEPKSVRRLFADTKGAPVFYKVEDCFRLMARDGEGKTLDVTLPSSRERIFSTLKELARDAEQGVQDFFELMDECAAGVDYVNKTGANQNKRYLLTHFPNFVRCGSHTVSEVFRALRLPPALCTVLGAYWVYLGVDPDRLSFLHYALMARQYFDDGSYIPAYTSYQMSLYLLDVVRRQGGVVKFNTKAKRLLVEDGQVRGVITDGGTYLCRTLISDISPHRLFGQMVPQNLVPSFHKKLAAARDGKFSARFLVLYLGLDAPADELGIRDYSIFLYSDPDPSKVYRTMMDQNEPVQSAVFVCPNVVNPEASPEGTCICTLTAMAPPELFEDLDGLAYLQLKERIAKGMLDLLESRTGFRLREHIEEYELATPVTFARYLGTPEGAAYGYEAQGLDDIVTRCRTVGEESLFENAWQAGAWGEFGDGYSSAYSSGRAAAGRALRYLEENPV